MSSINERIKNIVDSYYGGNVRDFERICGLKKDTLKHVVGGRLSKPSFDSIELIIRTVVRINPLWLITGEGEMIKDTALRESDASLYHFTSNYNGFLEILKGKIKPQYCREDISFFKENLEYANLTAEPIISAYPMFCLCDIPYERLIIHQKNYGKYGLGFKKSWAIRNSLNPLTYVVKDSYISECIGRLLSFFIKLREDKKYNSDKEFDSAYMSLSGMFMACKIYEKESRRYYDEKEWRWMPSFRMNIPVLAVDDDVTDEEFAKEKEKYQDIINKNLEVGLNFTLDDLTHIFVPENERGEFIIKMKNTYKNEDDIKKITSLISDNHTLEKYIKGSDEDAQKHVSSDSELIEELKRDMAKLEGQNELLREQLGMPERKNKKTAS